MEADKNNRLIAALITLLLMSGFFLILWFCGLQYTLPPPPEYGVEINLGNTDLGMGDTPLEDLSQTPQNTPAPLSSTDNIQTQTEESVAIPTKKNKPSPKKSSQESPTQLQETPTESTPQTNPNALYTGRKNQTASAQGSSAISGDEGREEGSVTGTGNSGSGGNGGISFSLKGRTLKSLARPTYDSDEQGVVVVKIWVNNQGEITRVQPGVQGTTTTDENLWEKARQAALKSKFTPDEDAPLEQVGVISYKFIRSR